MRTFTEFLEDIDPNTGFPIAAPKRPTPPPLPGKGNVASTAPSVGASMLGKKMAMKQENPFLYSATNKIRQVFTNNQKSVIKSNPLKIGDNNIVGGSLTLINKWGLTMDEVSALKKAGLLIDNGIGDMILKIEPFNQ